ncbi:Gfo/Idh/MocA family oxidoreductase [Amycolatopsis jejuensis]|uniref:Gfo/Idh/MocA family oxidoreductase n=1 Tax=Amycolatopsis jejuensis TaxID=330084 RepID=UPI0005252F2A|nr:Gfo/Idh/MocA family oxidoreductase [Amycolatopsis jejuensis]
MSGPIGFGVVAVGGMGAVHARNLAHRVPGAHLVAVTDIDAGRAKRVADELGAVACASYADVLARPDVDAVVVATPTALHGEQTIAAVHAGKHVLCEKPMTADLAEADRVVAAVEESGVVVRVGFQRRHDADWCHGAALVRDGRVGAPRLYFASFRERELFDGDALRDLLIHGNIHDLDAARWLLGEIDEISVVGQAINGGSVAEGAPAENLITSLRFASGALGVIDNGTNARFGFECRAEVIGSEATLRIGDSQGPAVTELRAGAMTQKLPADAAERFDTAYVALLADLCAAIRGEPEAGSMGATAAEGRAALVLALAAERSLIEGRPVRLEHGGEPAAVAYQMAN